jgi:hypothetical protein
MAAVTKELIDEGKPLAIYVGFKEAGNDVGSQVTAGCATFHIERFTCCTGRCACRQEIAAELYELV